MADEAPQNALMEAAVSHFLENSRIKSNGVREVPKAAYLDALKRHDITEAELRRVTDAIDFENTAAARVAVHDLEQKVAEADKESLKDATFRKGLSATVRLPTFGGATEVSVNAEVINPIPFKPDADGNGEQQFKTTYGRLKTTQNLKMRIHKDFHTEASERMRKALGIAD